MFSRGRTECPTPSSKAHILCCWEDGCAPSPFSPSVLRGQSVCKFPSSFPLSVFPHPRIYHTLVLSLTPSARDSWLLLISFNLYKLKRCFFFLSMKAIHMDVIYMKGFKSVSERHFSVLLSQLYFFSALKYILRGPCFTSPLALCVVRGSYTLQELSTDCYSAWIH